MPLFIWTDIYSVKIKTLDDQHKRLFSLINALHEALTVKPDKAVADRVVLDLVNYTLQHFIYEERLLEEHGYPGLDAQRKDHDDMTETVMKYKRAIEAKEDVNLLELLAFILDWLQEHILDSDMEYAPFLLKKGVI